MKLSNGCEIAFQKFIAFSAVIILAATFSGCETCKPGRQGPAKAYNIQVNLDPGLNGKCDVVDLIAVNPQSILRWERYSMSNYWRGGDPLRGDSKPNRIALSFAPGKPLVQTLSIDDAQWKSWLATGATHLLVLAELPGHHDDKEGNADARRFTLPLDECLWAKGAKTLNIIVQQSGITVTTPPRGSK